MTSRGRELSSESGTQGLSGSRRPPRIRSPHLRAAARETPAPEPHGRAHRPPPQPRRPPRRRLAERSHGPPPARSAQPIRGRQCPRHHGNCSLASVSGSGWSWRGTSRELRSLGTASELGLIYHIMNGKFIPLDPLSHFATPPRLGQSPFSLWFSGSVSLVILFLRFHM